MSSLTRGRLPARVYWRRRVVILVLVASVAVTLVRLLGGPNPDPGAPGLTAAAQHSRTQPSDAQRPETTASQAPAPTAAQLARQQARAERLAARRARLEARRAARAPLPEPEGRCADEDVVVTPVVDDAAAGREMQISLTLRTLTATACTWRLTPAHLTVTITSGEDDIWSSSECPRELVRRLAANSIVVRSETTATTSMTWDARRSEAGCPGNTRWAEPGYYRVDAAPLGGEPHDVQFRLLSPAEVVAPAAAAPGNR